MRRETRRSGLHHPPILIRVAVECEILTGPKGADPKVGGRRLFFDKKIKDRENAWGDSSQWPTPPADVI